MGSIRDSLVTPSGPAPLYSRPNPQLPPGGGGENLANARGPTVVEGKGEVEDYQWAHHPGYVLRYETDSGQPYYVPIRTPVSQRDKWAIGQYDRDTHSVPAEYHGPDDVRYDPDTGKKVTNNQLRQLLMQRYGHEIRREDAQADKDLAAYSAKHPPAPGDPVSEQQPMGMDQLQGWMNQ